MSEKLLKNKETIKETANEIIFDSDSKKVIFNKDLNSDELVRLVDGKKTISWEYKRQQNTPTRRTVEQGKQNGIIFKDADENVDIEYFTSKGEIKENIILRKPTKKTHYEFIVKVTGLFATKENDGSIAFKDCEDGQKTRYIIPAPFMYDAKNSKSYNVKYSLQNKDKDCYVFGVDIDGEWLNSKERVFPVTVDPQLVYVPTSALTVTGQISQVFDDTSYAEWVNNSSGEINLGGDYGVNEYKYRIKISIDPSKLSVLPSERVFARVRLFATGGLSSSHFLNNSNVTIDGSWVYVDISDALRTNVNAFDLFLESESEIMTTFAPMGTENEPCLQIFTTYADGKKQQLYPVEMFGRAKGYYNYEDRKLTTVITEISPENSVCQIPITRAYNENGLANVNKENSQLNLDETFLNGEYTDPYGYKHNVTENFYRKDEKGNKIFVHYSDVVLNADGSFYTTADGIDYEVKREEVLYEGIKAVTIPTKVKNAELYKSQSEEYVQAEEQVKNLEEFVSNLVYGTYVKNATTGEVSIETETVDLNDVKTQTVFKTFETENAINTKFLLAKEELEALKQLFGQEELLHKSKIYEPYVGVKNYCDQSMSISLLQHYKAFDEITDVINKYIAVAGNELNNQQPLPKNVEDSQVIPFTAITEDNYFLLDESGNQTDEITKAEMISLVQDRNFYLMLIEENLRQNEYQIEEILKQENYYLEKSFSNAKELEKAYTMYFSAVEKFETLKKNYPTSFIMDGSLIKGFNETGKLVVYISNNRQVTVERDKNDKVLRLYDESGSAVVFKYNDKNLLESITDVRGNRVEYTYSTDGGFIESAKYTDGEVLTFERSGVALSSITSSSGLKTQIAFASPSGAIESVQNLNGETALNKTTYTKADNSLTVEDSEGKTVTYYYTDGEVSEIREKINGIVVSAERYFKFYDEISFFKKKIKCAKENLYVSEENFSFASGETSYDYYDHFGKIICQTSTKTNGTTSDGKEIKVRNEIKYTYDSDDVLICQSSQTTVLHNWIEQEDFTQITENYYDEIKRLVKRVNYVVGEELINGKTVEEWIYDEKGNLTKSFTYNTLDSSSKFYTEHIYNADGKHIASLDQTGEYKTEIEYVDKTSLVKTQKLPNGSKFSYGYDLADNVTSITQSTRDGEENSTQRIYENGLLKKLISGNTTVEYTYTEDRKLKSVILNGSDSEQLQCSYAETEDGIVETFTECGKQRIIYKDKLGKVTKIVDGTKETVYIYDGKQRLVSETCDGKTITYTYDNLDNLIAVNGDVSESFVYDEITGKMKEQTVVGNWYRYSYSNDSSHKLKNVNCYDFNASYKIDPFGRIVSKDYLIDTTVIEREKFSYLKRGDRATVMPSAIYYGKESLEYKGIPLTESLKYEYDKCGNIVKVYENGALVIRYAYDSINRLIREDNKPLNKTYLFAYDNQGNILNKKVTAFTLVKTDEILSEFVEEKYAYDGDKLKHYKEYGFTYDEYGRACDHKGNNLDYDGSKVVGYGATTFAYNSKGQRTAKNSLTFRYDSSGNLVKQGENITFLYAYGELVGIKEGNEVYTYRKNAQKDIIEIVDRSGNVVVKYVYDAWGNHKVYALSNTGEDNSFVEVYDSSVGEIAEGYEGKIAIINPIRYRGYYYDTETGLYYLQSRYYDPQVGRFISPDSVDYLDPDSINGLNLYAYCGNNPVMYADPMGHDAIYVVLYDEDDGGLAIVGHAQLYYQDEKGHWWCTEYTGTSKKDAKVYNYKIGNSTADILKKLDEINSSYTYLEGDYASIYNFAQKNLGSNFGGYNVLSNNCLHYVKKVLEHTGKIKPVKGIIPRFYKPKEYKSIEKKKQSTSIIVIYSIGGGGGHIRCAFVDFNPLTSILRRYVF